VPEATSTQGPAPEAAPDPTKGAPLAPAVRVRLRVVDGRVTVEPDHGGDLGGVRAVLVAVDDPSGFSAVLEALAKR